VRIRRFFIVTGVVVLVLLCGAVFWFKQLCREPEAQEVPSLAVQLHAHRILAIFAHPDDEILAAGFLFDATKRGLVVNLITATKGEAGAAEPAICRHEDLGIVREAEVLKYGFALHLSAQEVWSFPDGKLSEEPEGELERRIVARVRAFKPDTILTFDPASGFTMHPDHRAIGRAVTEGFRDSGQPSYEPSLGAAFAPACLVYVLAPRKLMRMFGGARGKEVAAKEAAPQVAISVEPWIKIRGWEIHESQASYLRRQWGIPPWILYRFLNQELFAVTRQ
jgi:LmbE family N-acetylglucosaminyl deacetylase